MKQVIFTAILILTLYLSVSAQTEEFQNMPITDPDIFGKMSWKDEKLRLDDFAKGLKIEKDRVGFIVLQFDKNTTQDQKRKRMSRITAYLVKTKKIEKDRFNLVITALLNTEETMYWLVNKSEIPKQQIKIMTTATQTKKKFDLDQLCINTKQISLSC